MIKQISILILLFIISLNVASCETYIEYWNTSSGIHDSYIGESTNGDGAYGWFKELRIGNVAHFQGLKKLGIESINSGVIITEDFYWSDVTYKIGADILGTGTAGYNQGETKTFILYFIDEPLDFSDYSGAQTLLVEGGWDNSLIRSAKSCYGFVRSTAVDEIDATKYYSGYWSPLTPLSGGYDYDYITIKDFRNIITASKINDELWNINISRNNSNMAKYDIIGNVTNYYHEDVLEDFIFDTNIIEKPINVSGTNIYDEYFQYIFFTDVGDDTPTLTTDKTIYNTSEQITISFTNLDKITNDGNSPVELRKICILYPDNDEYTGYGKKYIYNLLYHEYEGNFTIDTTGLTPQTDYILFACDGMDGIIYQGDSFNVYPDNEYLSISCDSDNNCYTGNNAENTIYYKINNNSNIIIKDNDNNIINTFYNIIGNGSIIYTIPPDLEHLNTYPNWKVYLNNTDYATSFNKNMVVYWSLFESPSPTPSPYPTDTPDINISDQLDNLTVEIQPLKELLYGFVYIVIDNPDYDKDNIIDENEINHWFNSLIPMCLFLLLVILYIGLKKNRD